MALSNILSTACVYCRTGILRMDGSAQTVNIPVKWYFF